MTQTEEHVLKIAKIQSADGEARQVFLKRLVKTLSELPDDQWNKMSDPAQDWYNGAVEDMNAKKEVREFPEAEAPKATKRTKPTETDGQTAAPAAPVASAPATPAETTEAPPAEAPKEEKPKRGRKRKATAEGDGETPVAKPPRAKKERKPVVRLSMREKAEKRVKERKGGRHAYRQLVLENLDAADEDLIKLLSDKGFELAPATMKMIRNHTLETYLLLQDLGWLKKK